MPKSAETLAAKLSALAQTCVTRGLTDDDLAKFQKTADEQAMARKEDSSSHTRSVINPVKIARYASRSYTNDTSQNSLPVWRGPSIKDALSLSTNEALAQMFCLAFQTNYTLGTSLDQRNVTQPRRLSREKAPMFSQQSGNILSIPTLGTQIEHPIQTRSLPSRLIISLLESIGLNFRALKQQELLYGKLDVLSVSYNVVPINILDPEQDCPLPFAPFDIMPHILLLLTVISYCDRIPERVCGFFLSPRVCDMVESLFWLIHSIIFHPIQTTMPCMHLLSTRFEHEYEAYRANPSKTPPGECAVAGKVTLLPRHLNPVLANLCAQEYLRNRAADNFAAIERNWMGSHGSEKDYCTELLPFFLASSIVRGFMRCFPAYHHVFSPKFSSTVYENIVYLLTGIVPYPDILQELRSSFFEQEDYSTAMLQQHIPPGSSLLNPGPPTSKDTALTASLRSSAKSTGSTADSGLSDYTEQFLDPQRLILFRYSTKTNQLFWHGGAFADHSAVDAQSYNAATTIGERAASKVAIIKPIDYDFILFPDLTDGERSKYAVSRAVLRHVSPTRVSKGTRYSKMALLSSLQRTANEASLLQLSDIAGSSSSSVTHPNHAGNTMTESCASRTKRASSPPVLPASRQLLDSKTSMLRGIPTQGTPLRDANLRDSSSLPIAAASSRGSSSAENLMEPKSPLSRLHGCVENMDILVTGLGNQERERTSVHASLDHEAVRVARHRVPRSTLQSLDEITDMFSKTQKPSAAALKRSSAGVCGDTPFDMSRMLSQSPPRMPPSSVKDPYSDAGVYKLEYVHPTIAPKTTDTVHSIIAPEHNIEQTRKEEELALGLARMGLTLDANGMLPGADNRNSTTVDNTFVIRVDKRLNALRDGKPVSVLGSEVVTENDIVLNMHDEQYTNYIQAALEVAKKRTYLSGGEGNSVDLNVIKNMLLTKEDSGPNRQVKQILDEQADGCPAVPRDAEKNSALASAPATLDPVAVLSASVDGSIGSPLRVSSQSISLTHMTPLMVRYLTITNSPVPADFLSAFVSSTIPSPELGRSGFTQRLDNIRAGVGNPGGARGGLQGTQMGSIRRTRNDPWITVHEGRGQDPNQAHIQLRRAQMSAQDAARSADPSAGTFSLSLNEYGQATEVRPDTDKREPSGQKAGMALPPIQRSGRTSPNRFHLQYESAKHAIMQDAARAKEAARREMLALDVQRQLFLNKGLKGKANRAAALTRALVDGDDSEMKESEKAYLSYHATDSKELVLLRLREEINGRMQDLKNGEALARSIKRAEDTRRRRLDGMLTMHNQIERQGLSIDADTTVAALLTQGTHKQKPVSIAGTDLREHDFVGYVDYERGEASTEGRALDPTSPARKRGMQPRTHSSLL